MAHLSRAVCLLKALPAVLTEQAAFLQVHLVRCLHHFFRQWRWHILSGGFIHFHWVHFLYFCRLHRYMHIPTELFLIFARNSGIRTGDKPGAFKEIQTYSCSSCGICIDACQLNFSAGITNIQSAYLLKGIRNDEDVSDIANNCLMCGRCDQKCPVGIELTPDQDDNEKGRRGG